MKRNLLIGAVLACASMAYAGLDYIEYNFPGSSSTTGTAVQSKEYVVYGTVEAVQVDVNTTYASGTTGRVQVLDVYSNVFFDVAAIAADVQYRTRIPTHYTNGSAYVTQIYTNALGTYSDGYALLDRPVSAGKLQVRFAGASSSTSTNSIKVYVLFKRD